jgi:hypothetical protein
VLFRSEHGDNSALSDAAAVSDIDMIPNVTPETKAGFTFAADNSERTIGYNGSKRYVRLTVTPANNTGDAYLAIAACSAFVVCELGFSKPKLHFIKCTTAFPLIIVQLIIVNFCSFAV